MIHLLYSGLGGHGNVFFSMVQADDTKTQSYEALFMGIEEVRLEYIEQCNQLGIPWTFIKKNKKIDLRFFLSLFNQLRKSKSSIIFLHGSRYICLAKAASLCSTRSKKIIVRETQANHLKTRIEWLCLKLSLLLANKVVFLSEAFAQEVAGNVGTWFKPQKTTIIPNGLNLAVYKPITETSPHPGKLILGMQSRIVPIKDHETLIKAFALFKKTCQSHDPILLIAGDGSSKGQLQLMCKSLQIESSVVFTGLLNQSELVTFMQSLDIYIHASLGETMSTAIMQAMACGLPIIASDVKGISNMVQDQVTGVLIPVKDEQALCNAMLDLAVHSDKRSMLGRNALQYAVDHYSNAAMFARYQSLFDQLQNG